MFRLHGGHLQGRIPACLLEFSFRWPRFQIFAHGRACRAASFGYRSPISFSDHQFQHNNLEYILTY
jgi:hypothetical protein